MTIKYDFMEGQIKRVSKKLPSVTMKFIGEYCTPEGFTEAWEDFSGAEGEDPNQDFFPVFIPWLFFHWIPLQAKIVDTLSHKFLRVNHSKLSDIERSYVETGQKSPLRFFLLTEKKPGNIIVLKDVLLSTPLEPVTHECFDRSLSDAAPENSILFGQVFTISGHSSIESIAPIPLNSRMLTDILGFRDELIEEHGSLNLKILKEEQYEILDFYWDLVAACLAPPQIENTSGHDLSFHKLVYEVLDSGEAIRALASSTEDKDEEKELLLHVEAGRHLQEDTEFGWSSKKINPKLGGKTSLGFFVVKGNQLTVTVNSSQRADKIKKEISKRLGPSAKLKIDVIETPDFDKPQASKLSLGGVMSLNKIPIEVQEALKAKASAMKASWYDQPIPMLDNLSPRKAAKSAKGRELLEALIKEYDLSRQRHDPGNMLLLMNPSGEEIRRELGL